MGAADDWARSPYFELVEVQRRAIYQRLVHEIPAGPTRVLGLLADGELHHGRPRRTRRLLMQAASRMRLERQKALADQLEALADLLRQWPFLFIRGPRPGELALSSGLQRLALASEAKRGSRAPWEMHQLALLSARRVLPAGHPQLVDLELHLARSLAEAGSFREAACAIKRARQLARRLPWPALDAYCQGQLGKVLGTAGKKGRARSWIKRSLSLYLQVVPHHHPILLPTLRCQQNLENEGQKSAQVFEWIREILHRHFGPSATSPTTR